MAGLRETGVQWFYRKADQQMSGQLWYVVHLYAIFVSVVSVSWQLWHGVRTFQGKLLIYRFCVNKSIRDLFPSYIQHGRHVRCHVMVPRFGYDNHRKTLAFQDVKIGMSFTNALWFLCYCCNVPGLSVGG